ncbi:MAG: hypothetical protein K1X87_01655 [Dehalococcoidia bacterium]|nr:hypothetical protein [Dehalococcoidia bacterium]HRC62012.1 hypothetical protein [Dehalococcoidia bacterium]
MADHDHQMTEVPPELLRSIGTAVGRVLGHWPGGTNWDVLGCVECGFAQVRFHNGAKLAARVQVRGWNLFLDPPAPATPAGTTE